MRQGDQYHELRPAIVICVLEKPLLTACNNLHTDFRLRDEFGQVFSDDLQIHVLELTKLTATRENLSEATPVERWAYFLLNAENLTVAEIRKLFPEPEFAEAAGVLEMIKDNPDQMSDYISRLKYKLDEGWRIESTRAEALKEGELKGEKQGVLRGELIGQIVILQELLELTVPGCEDLSNYDVSQLKDLCAQLRHELRSRQTS
jgi:predicted transposase/invertase (TIGR01784 family)